MDLHILGNRLAERVGAGRVEFAAALPALGAGGHVVVTPGSAEECAQVMRVASAANAVVAPVGGGTALAHGNPIRQNNRPLMALRTTGMNRVVAYEPDDLTITAQAGMTIADLNAITRPNGQCLPFDVPLPERATLGGVIATNADGPRRLGYGTVKDLLIGARVVEASGALSKAGGRTVKNVSGYNMMRLWTGSYGTLAVVVEATFKLIPIPRESLTLARRFGDVAAAFAFLDALHGSFLTPVAAEVVMDEGAQVLIRAEGTPEQVARHAREIGGLAAVETAGAEVWRVVNDIPQTAEVADDEIVLKLGGLPSEMGATLARLGAVAGGLGLRLRVSARALSGVAYARARGGRAAHLQAALADGARVVALAAGRDVGVVNRWGAPPEGIEVMRRIKREFDPQDRLNPGRFVV